jgi:hypothetical protein
LQARRWKGRQIDQHTRRRQTHVEGCQQGLAARQQARFVAEFVKQVERLFKRMRAAI